jgi:parvulin-like peptidyl-prolyl isomerase
MTGIRVWLLILAAAVTAAACRSGDSRRQASSTAEEVEAGADRIVLQVADSDYKLKDFDQYVRAAIGSGVEGLDGSTLGPVFDEFIDQKLLLQAAREQGITISSEDKMDYLARLEEGILSAEEKTSFLASDSGPLIDQLKAEKYTRGIVQNLAVEESEVRDYYQRNQNEFILPERVAVSQVLLRTEQEAIEAWEKLRSASEDGFRELARSESIGPEAAAGGEMGVFQRGQLPQEMEEAVFALPEGEVGPVIESSYGFHIFRVDKKLPAETMSLEDAAASIEVKLLDLKSQAVLARHLQELEGRFDWTIFPENLPFLYNWTK